MNTFKVIRERLGVTQQELAEALGCSQGNVSLYEKGQTVLPDVAKKLIAFSGARGVLVTYEDLYGRVKVPKKAVSGGAAERPAARARDAKPTAKTRESKGRRG
jgi:putative transcriptional regulator